MVSRFFGQSPCQAPCWRCGACLGFSLSPLSVCLNKQTNIKRNYLQCAEGAVCSCLCVAWESWLSPWLPPVLQDSVWGSLPPGSLLFLLSLGLVPCFCHLYFNRLLIIFFFYSLGPWVPRSCLHFSNSATQQHGSYIGAPCVVELVKNRIWVLFLPCDPLSMFHFGQVIYLSVL